MTVNVSGFGTKITLVSTVTFPYGFQLSAFSDDVDPIDIEDYQAADHEMLLDGGMFPFQTANPIKATIRLIPNSDDDENMKIIMEAARVKQNIISLPDFIILTINYPDGSVLILSKGYIRKGPIANSIQSAGRMRSGSYELVFAEQNRIGGSVLGMVVSAASIATNIF